MPFIENTEQTSFLILDNSIISVTKTTIDELPSLTFITKEAANRKFSFSYANTTLQGIDYTLAIGTFSAAIENEDNTQALNAVNTVNCSKTLSQDDVYQLTFITAEPTNRKFNFRYTNETARDDAYDAIKVLINP